MIAARDISQKTFFAEWASLGLILLLPLAAAFMPGLLPFAIDSYTLTLLSKYVCFAIVALGIDVIWGYTGILSLGQGVFFALGGYAMGMHLLQNSSGQGIYASHLPDFMVFLDWKELPWYWAGSDSFLLTILLIGLVPGLFAFVFGYFAFRSRVKGVYFSIMTQALTWLMSILFFQNELGFGGNNGLTDFKHLLGYSLQKDSTKLVLYFLSVSLLLFFWFLCYRLTQAPIGKILVAVRDSENRLRFCGYRVTTFKLFAFTFAAVMSGIAGALYVPQVGIINPSEMSPSLSLEMVIWVAVGGRGTLLGPILGAFLVNGLKTWFTRAFPEFWPLLLGSLFILSTLYLPMGIVGLLHREGERFKVTLYPRLRRWVVQRSS